MDDAQKLRAINEAIWLRNNAHRLGREELFHIVEDIGEYGIYSARQIAKMTNNKISHQTVAKLCNKTDKTGGKLNIDSLEDIKECLYGKVNGKVNYSIVRSVIADGTSQGMLEKLSGISQSKISRACNNA